MGFDVAALAGGLGDIFGAGTAAAAEAAPEFAAGADVLGAGAGDALAATAAADIPGYGLAAADQAALYGVTDAGAAADLAGTGAAADLTGAGFAGGDLAGAVSSAADLGLAPGVSNLPANAAALGQAVGGAPATLPATLGGGAQSAGGIVPASSALPLPGSSFDLLQQSGAGLGGLTDTGPQYASAATGTLNDASVNEAWAPLANTNLADASNAATSTTADAIGNIPPTPTASQADVSGGMLAPQADAATYTAPGTGGAGGTGGGAGGGGAGGGGGGGGSGGGFDWWKAAGLGLAAAPLGITLARGQQTMPQQGLQSGALSNQLSADSMQLLNQAMQGQVMPGQQAALTQSRQGLINQARQQLYSQGIQNPEASSMWPQMMAQIDQQMAVAQQQFLTANIQEAFTGTGQAQTNLTNLAQQQVALDNAYTNAIAGATGSLGRLIGQSGGRIL